MELQEALTQIAVIRRQLARTELFRGYRALPVAFSGVLALAAAWMQPLYVPDPLQNPAAYLTLWMSVAMMSLLAAGIVLAVRYRHPDSTLMRTMIGFALGQFTPCLVAGGFLTLVLFSWARDSLWMLPGLWAVLFSLGIFASYRLLPSTVFWVGLYYLGTGLLCLGLAQGDSALAPWTMALSFGGGQLLTAVVLYWTLERTAEV